MILTQNYEPLKDYNLLHSHDVDTAQKIVTKMYCEHALVPLKGDTVAAKLNGIEGEHFNFGFLTYGVDAKIVLPPLSSCYHVNITLSGKSTVYNKNNTRFDSFAQANGAVLIPEHSYKVIWEKNTKQYAFRFHRQKLESHLATLICEPVTSPIRFETIFDLTSPTGMSLIRACLLLQTEWEQNSIIKISPAARRHLESFILTAFLAAAKNPHSEKLLIDYNSKDLTESLVRRVQKYIEENIHQLPSLADLTHYAKVSARTLQLAFKRHLNCTPMEYVRRIRLQRAHEQIINAAHTGEKITDIAMQWGFYNPGRFAQLYKRHYGCTPKETLLKQC